MLKKFLPQIIASLFLVGFVVYAWTEPSQAPPGGNVDAPLNVGTTTQYKAGALGIGGLLRAYSDAIFDGKVGIGTTTPSQKLDVIGQIHAAGDICTDAAGGKCLSAVGGGGVRMQVFDSNGTFTVPAGVTSLRVKLWGAGGGGAGGSNPPISCPTNYGAGGGGGGQYVETIINVTPGQNYTVI